MSIPFVQARHFTAGRTSPIKFLVIHDMEYPEHLDTAEKVAAWFAGSSAPRASTHYNIDADSIVQSVHDRDTAWCAPGCNNTGLHFEHAGYARQSRSEWLDDYGTKMLHLSAALVAEKGREHGVPLIKRDYLDIRAGRPGIVGHADVTKAFPNIGTHTDPGSSFPWDYYLNLVNVVAHAGGGGGTSAPPPSPHPAPAPAPAPSGAHAALTLDGVLGRHTIARWQHVMGTTVDGVISPGHSELVAAVQRRLNAAGAHDANGHALAVDGVGIASNEGNRYPATGHTHTIEALQGYLHSVPLDGYFSDPSNVVRKVQARLNTGRF